MESNFHVENECIRMIQKMLPITSRKFNEKRRFQVDSEIEREPSEVLSSVVEWEIYFLIVLLIYVAFSKFPYLSSDLYGCPVFFSLKL